jgi:hypothetical protein
MYGFKYPADSNIATTVENSNSTKTRGIEQKKVSHYYPKTDAFESVAFNS